MKRIALIAIGALCLAGFASDAAAISSGVVKGRITFYQNNGGYCPTTRNCTGATYPESQRGSWSPVANGKVYVYRTAGTPSLIGSGTTDGNGNYQISWLSTVTPGQVRITFKGEHKDSRFKLVDSVGVLYTFAGPAFTPVNGTTPTNPQNLSEIRFGTAASPNALVNLYDAAEHVWWNALRSSSAVLSSWGSQVVVSGIYDTPSDLYRCSVATGACASAEDDYVKVGPVSRWELPAVGHEMGHLVSYKVNPFVQTGDDGYPTKCDRSDVDCGDGHGELSPEWQHLQFEEGFATFVGMVALYTSAATNPIHCNHPLNLACGDGIANQKELSLGNDCHPNMQRAEINVTRMFWDIFDLHNEWPQPYDDNISRSYSAIYDGLVNFPAGTSNRQDDEQLNSARTEFDNRDGRNAEDYCALNPDLFNASAWQYEFNCGFAGTGNP